MHFGAGAVNWMEGADRIAICDYAQAAEGLGYEFLTLVDHVVMAHPAPDGTSRSRYPPLTHIQDILVSLGYLAGVTERIRLRTAVVLLPQRGPAVVAKQVAAADLFSGGRVELGLGVGWQPPEYEALGVPYHERGGRMDEALTVMTQLWTQERVDFRGRFYTLDGVAMEPKPLQRPHPPLWFGGTTRPAFRRVVQWGAGWLSRPAQTLEEIRESWEAIKDLARASGRDPGGIRLHAAVPIGPQEGTDALVARARALAAMGTTDIVFLTTGMPGAETPAEHLKQLERAHREVVPAL